MQYVTVRGCARYLGFSKLSYQHRPDVVNILNEKNVNERFSTHTHSHEMLAERSAVCMCVAEVAKNGEMWSAFMRSNTKCTLIYYI